MVLSWGRRLALAGILGAAACVAPTSDAPQTQRDPTPTGGPALSFEESGTLRVAPRQTVDIPLVWTGPDSDMQAWLEGDYADASLERGQVPVAGGRASLRLTAPSVPATFTLRARVAGASDAHLDVAVSANGFGALRLDPTYDGRRPRPEATASVFMGPTCAELARSPLKDGTPKETSPVGSPIVLTSIPAGGHVAVVVRIAFYASGCVDLASLVPDATRDVTVRVLDLPMALEQTNLDTRFSLDFDPTDAASWAQLLDTAGRKARTKFMPDNANEPGVLLDAMQSLVPASGRPTFASKRVQGDWDTRTASWFAARPPTIVKRVTDWLTAGRPLAGGPLYGRLDATGTNHGTVNFVPESFGSLDAAAAGLNVRSSFDWIADAGDVVHLNGSVHLWPSALAARAADAAARQAFGGAADVPDALAAALDCAGLGLELVASGTSYAGCDAGCTGALCRSALVERWRAASDASLAAGESVPINITAAAPATVGPNAEPTQFSGQWLGQIGSPTSAYGVFAAKGTARGAQGQLPR